MRVQRAYELGALPRRVLVDSHGRVWTGRDWQPQPAGPISTVGEKFERWSDVPFGWCDGTPWWK